MLVLEYYLGVEGSYRMDTSYCVMLEIRLLKGKETLNVDVLPILKFFIRHIQILELRIRVSDVNTC